MSNITFTKTEDRISPFDIPAGEVSHCRGCYEVKLDNKWHFLWNNTALCHSCYVEKIFCYPWDAEKNEVRMIASWSTSDEDIEAVRFNLSEIAKHPK